MQSNSNDLFAKLLANENLSVVRGQVKTASFNIKDRTLVLPQWQDMQEDTEHMLILHETGHALFTPEKYIDYSKDMPKIFAQYMNVVEDVRIERKMKDRYPGSKRSFLAGYKNLIEKDFFGISGRDVNSFNLIDRVNLFYKVGVSAGIKFSRAEWNIISLIDKADTIEDVFTAAKAMFDMATDQQNEESIMILSSDLEDDTGNMDPFDDYDQQLQGGGSFDEDYDREESDYDDETSKSNDSGSKMVENQKRLSDEALESKTQNAFDKNMEDSADVNTEYKYVEPKFARTLVNDKDRVVKYTQVINDFKEAFEVRRQKYSANGFDETAISLGVGVFEDVPKKASEFKYENSGIINNMAKEFEMRKSASSWKRAKVSKTGQLDPKKLYGYQIKDELFKQMLTVKEGKKHGMVFLLDWSGSMEYYMNNTLRQLMNLVLFARKVNIPYRVYAFSSCYNQSRYHIPPDQYKNNHEGIGASTEVTLLELFSDRMSERDTYTMIGCLLSNPFKRTGKMELGGTPLNEALMLQLNTLGDFIKTYSVEKPVFITLTDGEGQALQNTERFKTSQYKYGLDGSYIKTTTKAYLKDPVTGKQYPFSNEASVQTSAFMSMIRDRFGARTIGFNLLYNNQREVDQALHQVDSQLNVYRVQTELRSKKFMKLDATGYNDYYLIDNRSLEVVNDVDLSSITSETSSAVMARTMSKAFTKNKTSRVIMSNFAVAVA